MGEKPLQSHPHTTQSQMISNDESLKEYFYQGEDDINKAVLDTIACGSYGECFYAKIAEKLEKISGNNKA